jgi:hypothetical protein
LPRKKIVFEINTEFLAASIHAAFLLGLFSDPDDGGDVSPKRRLIFNGLHGVISQKIELFLSTAVRIANTRTELVVEMFICY